MNTSIDSELQSGEQKKTLSKKLLIIFFGIMILLTFFSNTINNFTLPRVKVEYPSSGALVKEVFASGEIIPKASQSEYTALNTAVEKVYVKAGETVKKGQLVMSLDKTSAMTTYRQEELNLQKLKLDMETVGEAGSETGNHSLAFKRDEAQQKYDMACHDFERTKGLFEAGAESRLNYEKAENQMKTTAREYKQACEDYSKGVKKAACDVMAQELKVAGLKRELDTKYELHAQYDGLVKEVNFTEGSLANSSKALFVIADQSQGYEFKMSVDDEQASYLARGDEFTVSLKSMRRSLKGVVSRMVTGTQGKKDVFLDVEAQGLAGGEAGQAFISKDIGFYDCLVSNSAVNKSEGSDCVWLIQEKQGAFKNELYVKKLNVTVLNSDINKSALQRSGLDQDSRIVCKVDGDRGLTDGGRVLLWE